MHTSDSGGVVGPIASATLFVASLLPEVPTMAQWICLLLSAIASILTIRKNIK